MTCDDIKMIMRAFRVGLSIMMSAPWSMDVNGVWTSRNWIQGQESLWQQWIDDQFKACVERGSIAPTGCG